LGRIDIVVDAGDAVDALPKEQGVAGFADGVRATAAVVTTKVK
jgi:hypothetical protein